MNYPKSKINRDAGATNRMSVEQFAERLSARMHKMMGALLSADRNYLTRGVITLPQLWILQQVLDAGKCSMHVISRNLGIKSSTVTGLMDRLVKLGLVRRLPSESDRRSVLAEITPKGRRILDQIHAERQRTIINMFKLISVQERADYLAIIEKIASQISPPSGKTP